MQIFTKRKFAKLTKEQQHKKCAEVLRNLYLHLQKTGSICSTLQEQYHTFSEWIEVEPIETFQPKNISDQYHHHLVKAQLSLKEHNLLPPIRTGDKAAKENFLSHAIYLDHLRSAYNVGSILRTVEALRIGSVHFSEQTPFIDNPKVCKTSMGSCDIVPCYQNAQLKDLPRPWIAIETSPTATNVHSFIFPEKCTLILGNEEYGVSDEVLEQVDLFIDVPLVGIKNSINVACAFAIVAAQIRRN